MLEIDDYVEVKNIRIPERNLNIGDIGYISILDLDKNEILFESNNSNRCYRLPIDSVEKLTDIFWIERSEKQKKIRREIEEEKKLKTKFIEEKRLEAINKIQNRFNLTEENIIEIFDIHDSLNNQIRNY